LTTTSQRLEFLAATDALKLIERANTVSSGGRQENVAEHSWHISLMSLLFADAAPDGTDHQRVRDLLIVHDLVEIHAGDTVVWDNTPDTDVRDRETAAAVRLFGLLSEHEASRFHDLWTEFDRQETIESRFARALDALHPMLMSWGPSSAGHPRVELRPSMVLTRKRAWLEEFPELWQIAQDAVQSAVERGLLTPDD
jgi:putative hydrolase of HD superfamily